jgi:hypothetical protein
MLTALGEILPDVADLVAAVLALVSNLLGSLTTNVQTTLTDAMVSHTILFFS